MKFRPILLLILFLLLIGISNAEQIKDGFGKTQLPDSSVYEGEFKNGLFNGKGILTWSNAACYKGEFKNGLMDGKGNYVGSDGSKYEGDYKDGILDGKGILVFANGDRYEGEFKNGLFNGRGVSFNANGDKYEGEFINGRFDGKGVFNNKAGVKYEGNFKDGYFEGSGILIYSSGDKYTGEFKANEFCGTGSLLYANGDLIIGEFKRGNIEDKGILIYANGTKYEGGFKSGRPDGKGRIIYTNGVKYEGEFKNGMFYPNNTLCNLKPKPELIENNQSLNVLPPKAVSEVSSSVVLITVEQSEPAFIGSKGTGFIIDKSGIIITVLHAIVAAKHIEIKLQDGRTFNDVSIVGYDVTSDVCLLKIPADNLPEVSFGDPHSIKVGGKVFFINIDNQKERAEFLIAEGEFNAIKEDIGQYSNMPYLNFISQSIHPGNSGSPLLNEAGKVIGLIQIEGVVAQGDNIQKKGLAIPIVRLLGFIDKYRNKQTSNLTLKEFESAMTNAQSCYYLGIRGGIGGIEALQEAVRLDPNFKEAHFELCLVYFMQRKFDEVIFEANKFIALEPQNAKIYYWRAQSYLYKDLFDEALLDCNKAIELDPNLSESYTLRGVINFALKNFNKSREMR